MKNYLISEAIGDIAGSAYEGGDLYIGKALLDAWNLLLLESDC